MVSVNLTKHILVRHGSALCSLCHDIFGNPLLLDKRNIKRHCRSIRHTTNLNARTKTAAVARPLQQKSQPQDFVYPDNTLFESETLPLGPQTLFPDSPLGNATTDNTEIPTWNDTEEEDNGPDFCLDRVQDLFAESAEDPQSSTATTGAFSGVESDDEPDPGSESESDISESDSDVAGPSSGTYRIKPGSTTQQSTEWFPYPFKTMYLTDMLFNSRRLSFSRPQMLAVLEFARQSGAQNVPSLSALQKLQERLKSSLGNPERRHVSPNGTVFYINEVTESLKQEMANPQVRPHMNFFPHVDGKRMSQAWHGYKMVHDIDDSYLTPCIHVNGRIFYVNELVQRKSDWFIPVRWITHGPAQELRAIGYIVNQTESGLSVQHTKRITVRVSTFLASFPELQARNAVPSFNDESKSFECKMPNPLRKAAGLRPVYSIPLIIFMDDASGNISKQWNKHWSCYLSNAALPREVLQAEYNVRFATTSPHATPSELTHGLRSSIQDAFNNPTVAFDCLTGQEVLIRPFVLFWAGDNPMQAEHCSSSGLNSNYFCRTCYVGGDDKFKRSIEGYPTLFEPGEKRTASETKRIINECLDMTVQPRMIQKIKNLARTSGIKDPVAQPVVEKLLALNTSMQKPPPGTPHRTPEQIEDLLRQELDRERSKGCLNPLLDMQGVDIHRDTPTEILHTVLLGVVKYFWGQSFFVIQKAKQVSVLESRLASVGLSGLNLPKLSARYVCQYHGALIGKHFKALVQIMAFVSYDLLPSDVLNAWLLLGRLTSLLWYTEIDDINLYTEELRLLIDDFLVNTARCSPSTLMVKPKFHFLVHLPSYIKRFGPALLFSTERFESFNGVFRAASTFSNRHAPSRDIARRFVNIERTKHISSGGYWREGSRWVRASDTLLKFASENKVFGKILGIPRNEMISPGQVRSRAKVKLQSWSAFTKDTAISATAPPEDTKDQYHLAVSLISQSADIVHAGADILLKQQLFGHVHVIFSCVSLNGDRMNFAAIETYNISNTKHALLDLPIASRSGTIVHVPVQDIVCLVNMQHDCSTNGACIGFNTVHEVQEREQTTRLQYRTKHADTTHFVLNLHALHNARQIRLALPSDLYARRPQNFERQKIFEAAVEKMKNMKEEKDKVAAAKRKARTIVEEALETSAANPGSEPGPPPATPRPKRKATENNSAATQVSKRPRRTEAPAIDSSRPSGLE